MRVVRLGLLAWALNRQSRLRFALLCVLIAMGLSVFIVLSELSRASTENLDGAVRADLGTVGEYNVTFVSDLGMQHRAFIRKVSAAIRDLPVRRFRFVDLLPAVRPVCPPYSANGLVPVFALRSTDGSLLPLSGQLHRNGFDLCLNGQVIPAHAIRETYPAERRAFGYGLVVDGRYAGLVRLTSTDPVRTALIIDAGEESDRTDQIRSALQQALRMRMSQYGTSPDEQITIVRVDDGQQVRAASNGVRLVYGLIGWGILLVVGLGILVAQLVVLRDRTWLLGLSRAVGARRSDLGLLVALDVMMTVTIGFAAAIGVCWLAQPAVSQFGQSSFHVALRLVRWDELPSLALAFTVTLILGAAYPTMRAIRLDPVEVLERR